MEQKRMARKYLSGMREADFIGLLNELFDEEYAQEVLESYKRAEFLRSKDGVYYGKITTDMHVFHIACRKTEEGWDILKFDFE